MLQTIEQIDKETDLEGKVILAKVYSNVSKELLFSVPFRVGKGGKTAVKRNIQAFKRDLKQSTLSFRIVMQEIEIIGGYIWTSSIVTR